MKMLTGCENCTELELATSEYIENCFPTWIDCSMVISKETSGRVAQLRCVYKVVWQHLGLFAFEHL